MVEALREQFEIDGAVAIGPGEGGLPRVVLRHPSGAGATVYLHGGHVASWTDAAGNELVFTSARSFWAAGKPIRGGIPLIFPQFGAGELPQHGLARTRPWTLQRTDRTNDGSVIATLALEADDETRSLWPADFRLELTVRLAEALTINLRVENRARGFMEFQTALHTYFAVADIERTRVYGLQGIDYLDSLQDRTRFTETRGIIAIGEEVDRIYVDAPDHLEIRDEAAGRLFTVDKHNFADVVLWNPWIEKSRRMEDYGDDEYQRMVCLETGNINHRIELGPGQSWEGRTKFGARRSELP